MRKLAALTAAFIFIVYIFAYIEVANTPVSILLTEEQVKKAYYKEKEKVLLDFLEKHMFRPDGAILTNLKSMPDAEATLSESIGILMDYSVRRGRKDLFDKEFDFLKSNMLVDGKYVKWREGGQQANCNAAIDDLRIIGTLLDAYNKWGNRQFWDMAGFIQDEMYDKQVVTGNICEFYDWKSDAVKKSIPLCYIDLYNLYRLSIFNKEWVEVADSGLEVLRNGRTTDGSPFFNKYYDYNTYNYLVDEEYKDNKGICITYSILTAIHLREFNENTSFFTSWLKSEMNKGKLYGWYDPYTFNSTQKIESTAVYALAAVYAKKSGEEELYRDLLGRMLQFMITDKKSQYYGGFGNQDTGEFYSFDNLTALWALSFASN